MFQAFAALICHQSHLRMHILFFIRIPIRRCVEIILAEHIVEFAPTDFTASPSFMEPVNRVRVQKLIAISPKVVHSIVVGSVVAVGPAISAITVTVALLASTGHLIKKAVAASTANATLLARSPLNAMP